MKKTKLARRKVIGGIGATVATMAISPVFSGPKTLTPGFSATQDLEDPTTKYPKPPFSSQLQPGPDWLAKWIRVGIMAKKVTKVLIVATSPFRRRCLLWLLFLKIFFISTTSIIFKKH